MTRVNIEGFNTVSIAPFCQHFENCGGCSFQHWNEATYRNWKREKLVTALAHRSLDVPVADVIDAHGAGRRRVVFHVREMDGQWCAGFMAPKSHDLVALDACPVLVKEFINAPAMAATFGPVLGPCDVAMTMADQGVDVSIKAERSAGMKRLPHLQELFHRHKLSRLNVNGDTVFAAGTPTVTIGKARVPLPVDSFLQATQQGEEMLAGLVATALFKSKYVCDLFCGIGPFALRLAETLRVHAVDIDAKAITCLTAAVNATPGLKPITLETRDLFRNPLVHQELNEFDAVVLDPPRAGAEAQCRNLAKSKVKRIAYVSCDVQSFARDAKILVAAGFKLKGVTPVDQFKWTAHIECVGDFQR